MELERRAAPALCCCRSLGTTELLEALFGAVLALADVSMPFLA